MKTENNELSVFDINKISFHNVNSNFENDFRSCYNQLISDINNKTDIFRNANAGNTLEILNKMVLCMPQYNEDSDFRKSYNEILIEYEGFTET